MGAADHTRTVLPRHLKESHRKKEACPGESWSCHRKRPIQGGYTPCPRDESFVGEEGFLLLDRQNISGLQRSLGQKWVRLL